ncbi:hypothetical protein HMPREF1982_02669 [Clostridiales bacterium oral taxon 876 str. F0540]|nr:hypothetical protein HMPREF1982_02669 [Clostridiales bacterium oral taxon 876 str. F0540]
MSLNVITTDSIEKLDKQIKALESLIPKDNDKDRDIHTKVLKELKTHRKILLNK